MFIMLPISYRYPRTTQWRTQEKIWGVHGKGSGLVGGPWSEPPPHEQQRIFENLQKIPEENCKMLYCRLFCKKISKPRVKFSRVWTKNTIVWGNFESVI